MTDNQTCYSTSSALRPNIVLIMTDGLGVSRTQARLRPFMLLMQSDGSRIQLYDLEKEDPCEADNIASMEAGGASEMRLRLQQWVASLPPGPPRSEEVPSAFRSEVGDGAVFEH